MIRNIFLVLVAFIYAAFVATEPLSHDHYEEDHAEENDANVTLGQICIIKLRVERPSSNPKRCAGRCLNC